MRAVLIKTLGLASFLFELPCWTVLEDISAGKALPIGCETNDTPECYGSICSASTPCLRI